MLHKSEKLIVKHPIFYVGLVPRGNLLLAEMDDGKYRLLRDDEPMEGEVWGAREIVPAVIAFQAMKVKLNGVVKTPRV